MKIALHNSDNMRFPSLPLMKLAAWHKAQGDTVEWFIPLMNDAYNRVYSSKVFSFTPDEPNLPRDVIRGGTGYGLSANLPDAIEHIMPDYSLYPGFKASLGFTTRGCIRSCPWCVVPGKEGKIHAHAELEEFLRPDCRDVVLMDNNILAHEHGIRQLERSITLGLRLDCNQGLDARLIAVDDALARLLSRVRWSKSIRLACDHKSQMPAVESSVKAIRRHGGKRYNFSCYVLVQDVEDALERIEFLRGLGVDPFAQPYREPGSKKVPAQNLLRLARWCNHKAIFKTVSWSQYQGGAA
ncbi:radical SAM protein [uncultured Desulfovibrio sp.]|uniref:radical SAM protein n=1 Tax=uncultured Desulfovibrio sp. TaxID=167968 RepID=UPI0027121082|nr:radical SAM protein [uncultured Desulfovibrio sp.]